MRTVLGIISLALVLSACGDDGSSPDRASETATPTTESSPGGLVGFDEALFPGEVDAGLDRLVEQAVDDLATRLGVDRAEVVVASANPVTWSNGSIGCPGPEMGYIQVLQDGTLIELEHGGRFYRYHSGGDRTSPFLCDQPNAVPPVGGGVGGGGGGGGAGAT